MSAAEIEQEWQEADFPEILPGPYIEVISPFDETNSFLSLDASILYIRKEPEVIDYPTPEKKQKRHIKRNIAAGIGLSAALLVGADIGLSVKESDDAMQRANVPASEFVAENAQMLEGKQIGMTFDEGSYSSTKEALQALDYFHNQLGIEPIRYKPGDMNQDAKVVNGKIEYVFSKSKPVIDKLMSFANVKITFDLGLKEYGWPEQRVAEGDQQNLIDLSNGKGILEPDSVLSQHVIDYEDAFVRFLVSNYSSEQLDKIEAFQFENEGFYKYGDNAIVNSKEQVEAEIENNMKTFPKKVKYLVNSAAFLNVDEITDTFKDLITKHPELKERLIMGIDYYRCIGPVNTPIGQVDPLDWPVFGRVDPLVWDKALWIWGNRLHDLPNVAEDVGFETQATEDGIPPWGGYTDGGDQFPADLANFQYAIERVSLFSIPGKEFTIGAWQLDELYKNRNNPDCSGNIKQIFALIKLINSKHSQEASSQVPLMSARIGGELVTLFVSNPLRKAPGLERDDLAIQRVREELRQISQG